MAHPWVDENRPVYPGTIKEGYLVKSPPLDKKGVMLKQWRQRWCVLTSPRNEAPCLLYFTDKQAVLTGRMPLNRVLLDTCTKVERALKHSSHSHVFAVHLPERIFYFSAISHEDMLEWVDVLSAHLKLEPQDTPPSPPPSPPPIPRGSATLPRMTKPPSTPETRRERSQSLLQSSNKRKDLPLPALPFSSSHTTSITEDAPPLPQRPEELKYSKHSC